MLRCCDAALCPMTSSHPSAPPSRQFLLHLLNLMFHLSHLNQKFHLFDLILKYQLLLKNQRIQHYRLIVINHLYQLYLK